MLAVLTMLASASTANRQPSEPWAGNYLELQPNRVFFFFFNSKFSWIFKPFRTVQQFDSVDESPWCQLCPVLKMSTLSCPYDVSSFLFLWCQLCPVFMMSALSCSYDDATLTSAATRNLCLHGETWPKKQKANAQSHIQQCSPRPGAIYTAAPLLNQCLAALLLLQAYAQRLYSHVQLCSKINKASAQFLIHTQLKGLSNRGDSWHWRENVDCSWPLFCLSDTLGFVDADTSEDVRFYGFVERR